MLKLQTKDHDREKKAIIYTKSDPDGNHEWLINLTDKNHLIRYGHEILDQNRSKIVLKNDGTLVITPRFRQFPTEIISLIVHQALDQQALYQYTLVNKQFYTEASPLLWKSPKIQHYRALDRFSSSLIDHQPPMARYIRKLHLSGKYWTDIYFLLLMPHLRLLEEMKIDDTTSITDACLRHLPRHCHQLKSLYLIQRPISQSLCIALAQHCHQLGQLELELGYDPLPNILEPLIDCPLQSVSINFAGKPGSVSEEIMADLSRFRHLTHLKFNKVAPTATKQLFLIKRLTDDTPPWPQLTSLLLEKCRLLDDADLIPFIQSHPHLAVINFGAGGQFTDESFYAMSVSLPHLTSVRLAYNQYISPDGIRRLIRHCHHLESLTFHFCKHLIPAYFPETPCEWDGTGRIFMLSKEQIHQIRLAQW